MFLRSFLLGIALTGVVSASAVESFCVGESQPQQFDTRHLEVEGFGAALVHDGGTLNSNEYWSATVSHVVYGTLVVPTNVTLTIERGATVKFVGGGIWAFGECRAEGVVFADVVSSDVPSYVLKSNVVTDATTTFSGRDYQDDFQRFDASQGFAFDTRGLFGEAPSGAAVHWGGRLDADETWAAGEKHLVYGTVTVPTNVTLTVERGAVVKLVGGGIQADGVLVAEGVSFTDLDDDSIGGDLRGNGWTQPLVSYEITGVVHDNAETSYLCFDTHEGFVMAGDSRSFAFDTRGHGAAGIVGAKVHFGEVASDETWSAGETHVVYGVLHVAAGVTLTIQPGAVVKFVGGGLSVNGLCVARGVTFTDLDDASRGLSRMDGALPYASYVLDGNIETDDTTVTLFRKGREDGFASPGVSRVFRLETDVERVRFAGAPREVAFSTAWDGSSAVEVSETRPDGSTVMLTNGTADCAGVFLWDAGVTPGLYTLRHVTDTNELTASFYRLFNAQVHSGPISETNVWEAGVVHVIDKSVTVKAGGTLFIEPGAVVKFFPGSGLTIETGGICTARDVIFTSVHDTSVGGDTLGEGGAMEPGEEEYLIVGYIRDSAATEYRYGTHSLSGTIAGVETWEANRVYVIDGTLTVAAGSGLTIASGAIVKFTSGSTLMIENGATCSAEGVIFTHIADDSAGGDTMGDGDETQPEIGAYTISGLILDDETTQYRYGAPVVTSGTISQSTFWRSRNVYRVTGNLTIAKGATLTIMPGAIVKFDDGKSLTVADGGTLNAIGTKAQPIVFTSIKDDVFGGDTNGDGDSSVPMPGDWVKVGINGGTANFKYAQILYSSKNSTTGAINMNENGGKVVFNNGIIAHGLYDGVGVESGDFSMANSVVTDCLLAFRHWPRGPIVNCVIYDCGRLTQGGGQTFVNCIFSKITETWEAFGFPQGTTYRNCCFWNEGGSVLTGEGRQDALTVCGKDGNIWGDPKFADPENGDFRIAVDSPCVDAGDGSLASGLDWYGQPRVTFPSAQQTGKPDAKGRFVDIGIYEVQPRNVKSDIDLSIVSVAAESSVTVGATLKVSWTVENLGSVNATGSWRDMFELIDSSGATVKLGSYTVSGSIVAGGQRVFTTSFRVPAAAVGEARLRVKVNPERDIFEGTATGNNVAIADGTIDIAVAAYSASEHSVVSIGAGSSMALTLPADSGVTALIIRGGVGISAYGAFDYLPKALRNDATAVRLEDGSLLLALPSSTNAGDFTFVIANGGYGEESVTIEPVTETLQITEVTPNRLANTGDGYLTIRGVALDKVSKVRLVGNATYSPAAIAATSSGELNVTFPLANAVTGAYALEIEDADGAAYRLDAAVEIYKPKMGPKFNAHIEIPQNIRQGRIYQGQIVYANNGDSDMKVPLLVLKAPGVKIGYAGSEAEMVDGELKFFAIGSQQSAGVLKPGDNGCIDFVFRSSSRVSFTLDVVTDDSNEWAVLQDNCSEVITRVNARGRKVVDAQQILNEINFIANNNGSAICGRISILRGASFDGIVVNAISSDGEVEAFDRVDANGRYILNGLKGNAAYTVRVVEGGTAKGQEMFLNAGEDINNVDILVTPSYRLNVKILNPIDQDVSLVTVKSLSGEILATAYIQRDGSLEFNSRDDVDEVIVVSEHSSGNVVEAHSDLQNETVILDYSAPIRIKGTVVDAYGLPVSNVSVVAENESDRSRVQTQTKENGTFVLNNLGSGEWCVYARSWKYQSVKSVLVNLDNQSVEDVKINVESVEVARISGACNLPDLGHVVFIEKEGPYVFEAEVMGGVYHIDEMPYGAYTVKLISFDDEVQNVFDTIKVEAPNAILNLNVKNVCSLSGVLEDENGNLLSGFIELTDAMGNEYVVFADSSSGFDEEFRSGHYSIVARSDGYVSAIGDVELSQSTDISITLKKAGSIKIQDFDGEADLIYVIDIDHNVTTVAADQTEELTIESLLPGEYSVVAKAGNEFFCASGVNVSAGECSDTNLSAADRSITVSIPGWNDQDEGVTHVRIEIPLLGSLNVVKPLDSGIVTFERLPSMPLVVFAVNEFGECVGKKIVDENTNSIQMNTSAMDEVELFADSSKRGKLILEDEQTGAESTYDCDANQRIKIDRVPSGFSRIWFMSSIGYCCSAKASDVLDGSNVFSLDKIPSTVVRLSVLSGLDCTLTLIDECAHSLFLTPDESGMVELHVSPMNYSIVVDKDGRRKRMSFPVPGQENYEIGLPCEVEKRVTTVLKKAKLLAKGQLNNAMPAEQLQLTGSLDGYWNQYQSLAKLYPSPACEFNLHIYNEFWSARSKFYRELTNAEGWKSAILDDSKMLALEATGRGFQYVPVSGVVYSIGDIIREVNGINHDDSAEEEYLWELDTVSRKIVLTAKQAYDDILERIRKNDSTMSKLENKITENTLRKKALHKKKKYGLTPDEAKELEQLTKTLAKDRDTLQRCKETWVWLKQLAEKARLKYLHALSHTKGLRKLNKIKVPKGLKSLLGKLLLVPGAYDDIAWLYNKLRCLYEKAQKYHEALAEMKEAYARYIAAYDRQYHEHDDNVLCGYIEENVDVATAQTLSSYDPNEMAGPLGKGDPETERFVKPGEWMTYTVYFENKSDATAAAQEVMVTNPLSEWLDWSTFEMGEVAFNNQIDLGLSGKQNGTSEVTMKGTSYLVRSKVTLDKTEGKVDWYLRIVDPSTPTTWPDDVFAGFLPPNDETFRGEGHLTYRVKVREDAPKGVRIDNSATIVFDYNDPIETDPAWWNTVAQGRGVTVTVNGVESTLDLIVGLPYGELPEPGAAPKGCSFGGWYTAPRGPHGTGRLVTATSLVEAGDAGLYQYWEPNAYTVHFEPNGADGGVMADQAFVYGEPQALAHTSFKKVGHSFAGWVTSADGAVKYADGATVKNLTDADGGVVTLFAVWKSAGPNIVCEIAAEYRTKADVGVVPVKVVNVKEAVKIAVKGLPSGVKFTAKDVKATAKSAAVSANSIYGAPTKSGVYAATVTVTPTDKKSKMTPIVKGLTFVVRDPGEHVVVADFDAAQGSVKGMGVYAPGKKVTLRATAAKGWVFSGWYDGDTLGSRLASYVLTMPNKDVKVAARFVTVAADKGSIALAVTAGGKNIVQTKSITVKQGMYVEWPVAASALSATTVKVSGLPSGLKFTAKDVKATKTSAAVSANSIYGTPKTASKVDKNGKVTPSKVKITVTTAGKSKQEYVLDVTVRGIPAEGTFNGGMVGSGASLTSGEDAASPLGGLVTLTVAKTGKISGKYLADGKTWTLSAAGFDTWDDNDRLTATLTAKSGKEVKTVALAYEDGHVAGLSAPRSEDAAGTVLFEAWRNEWKTEPQKSLAATLKGQKVTVGENGNIVLTVGASGAVTAKGTFGSYSASCSTVLIPTESKGRYIVYLYFPPKAGKFGGWASSVVISTAGE